MLTIKNLLIMLLSFLSFSNFSLADTFVVTNLNDPGAGSLRQAITNSNLNPGLDVIVFEEGLAGTIFLNIGPLSIQDDLTINGPGAEIITIDADSKSPIININDGDDEKNSIININGLRFNKGIADTGAEIDSFENLTVNSCEFLNGNALTSGGSIYNRRLLTVESCQFENNSAEFGGGAIFNEGIIISINNSEFRFNDASIGGAILNENANIDLVTNSTFSYNTAFNGCAIYNDGGGIVQISNSTFNENFSKSLFGDGGAISNNQGGVISNLINSTFSENSAYIGSAIRNDGFVNISFTTIANNFISPPAPPTPIPFPTATPNPSFPTPPPPPMAGIATLNNGQTNIRNSIVAYNSPNNCEELFGFVNDFGGNYSDDFSCGFTGDDSVILLDSLADNGGPTETMNLIGGDPVNGATVNCDALNENGNPTGIPIGVDQRYFPRPFGVRCDSGAVENMPASIVTVTKTSQPPGMEGFEFVSNGFGSLVGCGLTGDSGKFNLDDGDSERCIVPVGDYTIREKVPNGYRLLIVCFGENPNLIVDDEKGEIMFSVPESEPSPDVDCIFNNIKKNNGGGGCALAGGSNNSSFVLLLLIPTLVILRRFRRKNRFRFFKASEYKTNKL